MHDRPTLAVVPTTRPLATRLAPAILALAVCLPAIAGAEPPARSAPRMGDGDRNRIVVEDVERRGRTLVFREVEIERGGWLVLHPFRDGKPVGEIYVGATYVPAGVSRDVAVTVQTAPEPRPGTRFVVMLHSDVNEDRTFDFVFVDERSVKDAAVFEGDKMIAHVIRTP